MLDPAAFIYEGYADLTAERCIRQALGGGKFRAGASHWSPRITPLLAVLSDTSEVVLKFDPGPTCDLGRRARAGMWHYDVSRGGSVERDAPAKNERIFADIGDALCYAIDEMAAGAAAGADAEQPIEARRRRLEADHITVKKAAVTSTSPFPPPGGDRRLPQDQQVVPRGRRPTLRHTGERDARA